ncbi:MAG TPA: hypothetical protein VGH74_04530 [Planctomycetaceae bacterium]|jgi:hypothetical protein
MSHGWRFTAVFFASVGLTVIVVLRAGQTARADDPNQETTLPAAAVAPASPETAASPEKYKLIFKFRQNQIVHQEISHEFQLTTSKNQDSETVHNSSKSKRHYRVAAVDDKTGIADLEMIIDWVHMLASFDKNDGSTTDPIEFQSDDPSKQPKKFDHILASIGKRAWLCFSPTGAPVKGPPAQTQAGKTAAGAPSPSKAATSNVTDGTLEAYLFPLPEHAVGIGETWKEPFDVRVKDDEQNLVKIRLQRTYKLAQVKNGRAVIECRTFILTPIQNPAVAAQFIERESSGKIEFDIEQGMIISREWSVDKTIINAVGANSSMRAKSRYREKLLGSEATPDRRGRIVPTSTNKK